MTQQPEDNRVIAEDAEQYNATLVRRVDLSDDLAYLWVRFDGPVELRMLYEGDDVFSVSAR